MLRPRRKNAGPGARMARPSCLAPMGHLNIQTTRDPLLLFNERLKRILPTGTNAQSSLGAPLSLLQGRPGIRDDVRRRDVRAVTGATSPITVTPA
jgi:hypothetical protein